MKRGIAGFKLKGFVLGQDKIESYPYLVELLSSVYTGQKKNLDPVSLWPWTRAGAKIPGQNELKNFKKKTRFPVLEHHFPVLEHHFPFLEHLFLF